MAAGLIDSGVPLVSKYNLALVDLDGVVRRGTSAIEYASESLDRAKELGLKQFFVTNNASITVEKIAEQLIELGICATPDEVMSAALAGAALLKTQLQPGDKVLVVGGSGLIEAVQKAGFTVIRSSSTGAADQHPKAVIMGYSPDIGWPDLAEAAYAVNDGAWFVATNLDKSLPTQRGYAPGNGALVGAVQAATQKVPVSDGKPSPAMYQLCVARYVPDQHSQNHEIVPLVIGDRLDTDLGGARAAHYDGLLVLTGVSSARDAVLAPPECRPDYIGADLRALFDVHAAPHEGPGNWWLSAGRGARVVGNRLEIDGNGPVGIDAVRAACTAVWNANDHGIDIDPTSVPEFSS